ncbi:hypothetical protein ACFTWF_35130 [Rhodococcus sp. NPDC056960]|uniref:hypothetical protein n=1 Tax=Rhodococcus sp. NPDC056960 TaxID=3345982 RepID=UPI00363E22BB
MMTESWTDWAAGDPDTDDAAADRRMYEQISTTAAPPPAESLASSSWHSPDETPTPVIVIGHRGGSGATTTALGVGSALPGLLRPALIDAAGQGPGSDLWERGLGASTGANPRHASSVGEMGQWQLRAGVVWGLVDDPHRHRGLVAMLPSLGLTPVVDGGCGLQVLASIPLGQAGWPPIVLTVSPRGGEINRLPALLDRLGNCIGATIDHPDAPGLAAVHVVVTNTRPATQPIVDHLRTHLAGRVGSVSAIPHDPHIAECADFDFAALAPDTAAAYHQLAALTCPPIAAYGDTEFEHEDRNNEEER